MQELLEMYFSNFVWAFYIYCIFQATFLHFSFGGALGVAGRLLLEHIIVHPLRMRSNRSTRKLLFFCQTHKSTFHSLFHLWGGSEISQQLSINLRLFSRCCCSPAPTAFAPFTPVFHHPSLPPAHPSCQTRFQLPHPAPSPHT